MLNKSINSFKNKTLTDPKRLNGSVSPDVFWQYRKLLVLTVTLQSQFDIAQGPSVLQQVGCSIWQDVVRFGRFQEQLQFHAVLPCAR